MVRYVFICVGTFLVSFGSGGHKTVDGGDEQSVEDNQPKAIKDDIFEIIPPVVWVRIFDDLVNVVVNGGVGIVPEMIVVIGNMSQVDVTDDACKRRSDAVLRE